MKNKYQYQFEHILSINYIINSIQRVQTQVLSCSFLPIKNTTVYVCYIYGYNKICSNHNCQNLPLNNINYMIKILCIYKCLYCIRILFSSVGRSKEKKFRIYKFRVDVEMLYRLCLCFIEHLSTFSGPT